MSINAAGAGVFRETPAIGCPNQFLNEESRRYILFKQSKVSGDISVLEGSNDGQNINVSQ